MATNKGMIPKEEVRVDNEDFMNLRVLYSDTPMASVIRVMWVPNARGWGGSDHVFAGREMYTYHDNNGSASAYIGGDYMIPKEITETISICQSTNTMANLTDRVYNLYFLSVIDPRGISSGNGPFVLSITSTYNIAGGSYDFGGFGI